MWYETFFEAETDFAFWIETYYQGPLLSEKESIFLWEGILWKKVYIYEREFYAIRRFRGRDSKKILHQSLLSLSTWLKFDEVNKVNSYSA